MSVPSAALYSLWPSLLSYVLSFMMIGVYWVAHHNIFHLIRWSNRLLLWANLLFLLCVAFVPFPAALLGRYPAQRIAAIIYGATSIHSETVCRRSNSLYSMERQFARG